MSEIQRYDFDKAWGIERNDQGIYVEYDDHAAIVAQLEAELAEARKVLQMCFDDSCKESGKLTKKTVLEVMKHANLQA